MGFNIRKYSDAYNDFFNFDQKNREERLIEENEVIAHSNINRKNLRKKVGFWDKIKSFFTSHQKTEKNQVKQNEKEISSEITKEITSETELKTLLAENGGKLENMKLILSGTYSGNYKINGTNLNIIGNASNPPTFKGGENLRFSVLSIMGDNINIENIKFQNINNDHAIQINKNTNNLTISNCEIKNCKRGIKSLGENIVIEDCNISQYSIDAIKIGNSNTTIQDCNIFQPTKPKKEDKNYHADAIQIYFESENKKEKFSGNGILNNIIIRNNIIDGKSYKNKKLQGIMATQVILNHAIIEDSTISIDTIHGISGAFTGNSVIKNNSLYQTNQGETPKINISQPKAAQGYVNSNNNFKSDVVTENNIFYDEALNRINSSDHRKGTT